MTWTSQRSSAAKPRKPKPQQNFTGGGIHLPPFSFAVQSRDAAASRGQIYCLGPLGMSLDDLRHYFRKLLPLAWQRTGRNDPVSMVLLLRKPHFFTAAELRAAAERAWHTSFAGESSSSRHCVVQKNAATIMKAGRHGLVFFHRGEPYFRLSAKQIVDWLPGEDQRT